MNIRTGNQLLVQFSGIELKEFQSVISCGFSVLQPT